MAIAHSANGIGLRHDLVAHLTAVARTAGEFATGLSGSELAYYAGLWHDLGKFHPDFQAYLLRSEADPRARGHGPDHKAAGSSLAFGQCQPICFLIQGHHGGLRDSKDFAGWLQEKESGTAVKEALALARAAVPGLVPDHPILVPDFARKDPFALEMFLRLIFSALVDADFLDTEQHFRDDRSAARGSEVTVEELWRRFEADQATVMSNADGLVNAVRADVYRSAVAAAENERGFFRLTVPTGGGKTRSAMAFALQHAHRHGLKRVIVAVPFISITEQTAAVYRELFRDVDGRIVLEDHSMASTGDEDTDGDFHSDAVWDRLAAENWDAPVIVTTTVQLFESLFGNRTSRTRKLHRLAGSVIVLDEAQALPARLLTPILDALGQLVRNYGASVVISTATQPAFEAIPAFAQVTATEIVPSPERHFDSLRRVEYEWRTGPDAMSWPAVAAELSSQSQALAVVNTKKDALVLLEALADPEALHLSTLLCGAHRRDVITEVKRRLKAKEPCRLVSTQVIEAGVDLDFPFVMRALAPLDSIIQAAGRCNREGRIEHGRVVVFEPEGGGLPQGEYRTATDVTRTLLAMGNLDPDTPASATAYFRRLFGSLDPDRDNIQALRRSLGYESVARTFRMIEDDTYSVVITTYGTDADRRNVQRWLDELRAGSARARELRRRLQPYVVAVRRPEALRLKSSGLIDEVRPGYGIWTGGYDDVVGFTGADPDVLIV